MPSPNNTDRAILHFKSAEQWQNWLVEHAESGTPIWLKISKKQTTQPSVTYQEALDVALCHGWIDGQKDKLDEVFWLQRFSPRTKKSPWSQINREKCQKLIEAGMMQARGLAEITAAQKDGRWDKAYAAGKNTQVPEDFIAALREHPQAEAAFKALNRQNLFSIAYRLQEPKKPETREKRLRAFIEMLARGEKPHS